MRSAWEALLARSPQASVFSHLALGEHVGRAFGLRPRVAGAWEGDVLRAGVLLYEKRRGPYCAAAIPPLVPRVSPLLDRPPREADTHYRRSPLQALLGCVAERFHQASLAAHPSLVDARPFQWGGWHVTPAYTYARDLRPGEEVTAAWSSTTRHAWQNHREAFEVAEGVDGLDEVLALVEASHERQQQPLSVPSAAMRSLLARLAESGLARLFVARRDGDAEAGVAVLSDGRAAHYWLAGSRPGPAMTVLVAAVLTRLRDEGVAYFDFAGANTPSIAEFKRKFGCRLVPYVRARRVSRPELRLLDALRRRSF
ncbi:MAG: GNAT family N-acetyltransferase [Bacteroidota bacterium]